MAHEFSYKACGLVFEVVTSNSFLMTMPVSLLSSLWCVPVVRAITVCIGIASAWPSICSADEPCDSSEMSPRSCPNSPSFWNPRVVVLEGFVVLALLAMVSSEWVERCFFHVWKICGMTTGRVLHMIAQTISATVRMRKTTTPSAQMHELAHSHLGKKREPSKSLQLGSVLSSVSTSRSTIRASSSRQALRIAISRSV